MAFYEYNLFGFIIFNSSLAYFDHRRSRNANRFRADDNEAARASVMAGKAALWEFKKKFIPVYLLAFGADWLQIRIRSSKHSNQKGLSEETVAQLFTIGFTSAAVTASFVGSLADRYGRKTACLFFCIAYAMSCFTILFDSITLLVAGRVLGGLSTTLMYSAFESWMVTEFHRRHLEEAGSLNDIFGIMTTLNGVVAILAGIFAQELSDLLRTQAAPFMASAVLLLLAFAFVSKGWNENYGDSARNGGASVTLLDDPGKQKKVVNGFSYVLAGNHVDKRLWALCLASSCFEGSMYLWIFFKFPALKLSHEEAGLGEELPFGIIFAALMCAMMLGSLFFTYYSSLKSKQGTMSASKLLMATLFVASGCFVVPVLIHNEAVTFWCFCVFEICCGIYFPSIAHLKEKAIEDGVRAKIYGILRIPLNVFVVLGLMLTKDGLRHRENVFIICSGALASAAAAMGGFTAEY
ncbi:hypothetical protein B0J14DRAFT_472622 [Halenospora varia]|nr:hypothetical protein B0J14DRAFT_472622 [Halenospora varia]